MRVLCLCMCAAVPFGYVVAASAESPRLVSYQGRILNASGQIVPDGNYDLNLRIYDAAVGGNMIWHETHNGTAVVGGVFNVLLGSKKAPSPSLSYLHFQDSLRWLGVTIGTDPELSPRTRLTSVPYAFKVSTVDGAQGGSVTGSLNASGSILSGRGGISDGTLEVRDFYSGLAVAQIFNLRRAGSSDYGGAIYLNDESFEAIAVIQPDRDGTGAELGIQSQAGPLFDNCFWVDGNANGTGNPRMWIKGSSQFADFDMRMSGDSSVDLPVDAINSFETKDEPGVASYASSNATSLTTLGYYTLLSRTITLPADGYVFAIGTCQAVLWHSTGTSTRSWFGISTVENLLSGTQDLELKMPSSAATGDYYVPVTSQTVINLTAGTQTIYYLAYKGGSESTTIDVFDKQLSLMFFPTAYGAVTSAVANSDDDARVIQPTLLTLQELDAERKESVDANNARIARELAAVKAQLDALSRELKANKVHQIDK